MALRIYGIGKAPDGTQYNAAIYDTDWVSSDSAFQIAKGGIKIEWKSDNDSDILSPIYGSSASVDMLINVSETGLGTFVNDLRTSKEGRFFLEITTQAGAKIWRGIIAPDALGNETDEGPIYRVTITASCGLALLKKVPYLNSGALYYGRYRLTQHLVNALGKLAHVSTFWAADDAFLETSLDWWEATMTANDANDPLYLSYVDHAAFYDFKTKGGIDDDVLSCYDVIKHICLAFGCRIRMRDAKFVVEQIDYRENSTYNWRSYKKNGDQKTYGAYSGTLSVDQTEANAAKLSYAAYDYVSQIAKARAFYEVRMRRNFWQNIILAQGTTFNFNQTISSQSGAVTLRIRGTFFITIKNNTYSGQSSDVIIPQINIKLKIGDRYLKRAVTFSNFSTFNENAEWTTVSTDNFVLVSGGQKVPPTNSTASYVQGLDFITPPLPADGDLNSISATFEQLKKNDGSDVDETQFTITWSAGGLWMEVYDSGTPDVQEDEILYESENADGGTDTWEQNVRIGSGSVNYLGAVVNSTASSGLSAWGQGSGTRDKALTSLMVKRAADGRLRVKKRLNAQLYGDGCNQVRKLLTTSDSLKWLDMRVKWSVTENIVDGTWLEMVYGNSNVKTPVKVKILSGGTNNPTVINPTSTSPTTGGNSPFMANPPGAILNPLSFNSLNTAITKGATVTSISVGTALAGNEFAAGDKVKIVNPVTGQFQTFTVASAPSAGATAISVNSATAAFDIPQNAGLFVQLTPQAGGGGVADGDKGDITVSSSGTVWTIDNNVISNAKIRQSAALSVVGRSANSTGDVADIAAANSGDVLIRKNTNVLEFGKLQNTSFDDGTITSTRLFLNSGVLVGRVLSGSGSGASLNKTQVYSFLGISGAGGRVPIFTAAETISTDADLTYASDRLGAKMYINSGSDLYTTVTFGTGAGTSPTLIDISGGCNFVRVKFTTGTSPSASADVLQITLPVEFLNEQCPALSAYNANAAGQMTNFYTDPTTTTITLKITTALSASTAYDIGFVIFGR
jgi:hypothetical protein